MQSSDAIFGTYRTGPALQNHSGYLSTRNCTDDQEWFCPIRNRIRQRSIGRFMGQIFAAGKKPDHWPSSPGHMITHRPAQHRIFCFNRVQQRALSQRSIEFKSYFSVDVRQRSQVWRKNNANHGNVCASTDSTAGKSRTIGFHLSPASTEAYTWTPVVPK